jgi:hypothetical protein
MTATNWTECLYWVVRIGAIMFPFAWGIFDILTRGK